MRKVFQLEYMSVLEKKFPEQFGPKMEWEIGGNHKWHDPTYDQTAKVKPVPRVVKVKRTRKKPPARMPSKILEARELVRWATVDELENSPIIRKAAQTYRDWKTKHAPRRHGSKKLH